MALSGLDIYKLLPKTNCRECGFPTCLAFAMQLAKKAVSLDKCPYVSQEAKAALEASSLPPIRLISIGAGENKLEIGNETVLFRHEEKFHHPGGIGVIISDDSSDGEIKNALKELSALRFERVGQEIQINLIAVKQKTDAQRFSAVVKMIAQGCSLGLVLISEDTQALNLALEQVRDSHPLLYAASKENLSDFAKLATTFQAPLVVSAASVDDLSLLTKELNNQGVSDLVLELRERPCSELIWDLTQCRRLALKKQERSLGYPVLVNIQEKDAYSAALLAATYIVKYAGIVLIETRKPEEILAILTLRQNIYTDPQKPLQIEAKLYPVGAANADSPLLVTTNFSLTYYTVLGEVEASKLPAYILSVDTEGMSVLTAWAAEKFTAESVALGMEKSKVNELFSQKRVVIPGYVAVMSGDLEDKSGWQVVVGPKEASGIPSFLKNLA